MGSLVPCCILRDSKRWRGEQEQSVYFVSLISQRTYGSTTAEVIEATSERGGGSRDPFVVKVIIAGLPM